MIFIPLPFVVTILLFVLLGTLLRRNEISSANRPFLLLILVSALLSVLSGLRWGYGVTGAILFLAPVAAAAIPPLAYAGVMELMHRRREPRVLRLGVHAIPVLVIIGLLAIWRSAIDIALIAIFVGYAMAILRLMRPGTDALRLAPFEWATPVYRAIVFAALALLFSAAIDAFVFFDLVWARGDYARPVIAIGNLMSLIILSIAAAAASRSHADTQPADVAPRPESDEDRETLPLVESLMRDRRVYRDAELNLDRLARKLGMPARQISTAINRATGKNVSQFVNEFRIGEACSLLSETDRPVTEIMFDVGFQTKSNFNREFRRVTDMTPLEWRERTTRPSSIAI